MIHFKDKDGQSMCGTVGNDDILKNVPYGVILHDLLYHNKSMCKYCKLVFLHDDAKNRQGKDV